MNCSFADESGDDSNQKLQEIIGLFQNNQFDDARSELMNQENDLAVAVQGDAAGHLLLGRTYFYAEMDGKAAAEFNAALQLDPSLSDAHFFLGLVQRYADDLENAEKSLRKAIELNSGDRKLFLELGQTLQMKGDPDAASTAYQSVLSMDEGDYDAHVNLATIYAIKGETDDAEKHFLAALERNPTDIGSQYNLGQLYQDTRQHNRAIERFTRVVEANPNDWRAISKLVQENEAIGDKTARDNAIEAIYEIWASGSEADLREQGFYIREQLVTENGQLFVLEYFELSGTRPRKYVFNLQNPETEETLFVVSLGSYDTTTEFARATGDIGADERLFHLDGYSPNGSHYTYGFFNPMPTYDVIKELALDALEEELEIVSSTIIPE
ncbi:MAG: tetratricopeptide repeat protein [Pseudomonadota bacterium]